MRAQSRRIIASKSLRRSTLKSYMLFALLRQFKKKQFTDGQQIAVKGTVRIIAARKSQSMYVVTDYGLSTHAYVFGPIYEASFDSLIFVVQTCF